MFLQIYECRNKQYELVTLYMESSFACGIEVNLEKKN